MISCPTETRPRNLDTRPENRVGGFSVASYSCTSVTWSNPTEPHWETGHVGTSDASGICRWLSKDPIGIAGGLNQYVAFGNNPVMSRDPFGLQVVDTSYVDAELARRNGVQQGVGELASGIRDGFDAVASMNPVVGANEALTGKSATGQGLSGADRGLAAAGFFGGFFKFFRAGSCAKRINGVLNGLEAGRNVGKRVVGSADELNDVFRSLSRGGDAVQNSSYPGTLVKLPDGSTVGLRQASKSGGPVIDIKLPNGAERKVHVTP